MSNVTAARAADASTCRSRAITKSPPLLGGTGRSHLDPLVSTKLAPIRPIGKRRLARVRLAPVDAQGQKDTAHIDKDWTIDRRLIDGVKTRDVRNIVTANGITTELY